MNQDNNQTSLLLKAILAMQVLMLILFAGAYFANSSLRAEYKKQVQQYQAKEAEYDKQMEQYKVQLADYNKQRSDYDKQSQQYKDQLATWQKEVAVYTNSA